MKVKCLMIKNIGRDCTERNAANCVRNYKPGYKRRAFFMHKPGAKQREVNMEATYFIHIVWLIIKIIAAMYSESKEKNNTAEEETI